MATITLATLAKGPLTRHQGSLGKEGAASGQGPAVPLGQGFLKHYDKHKPGGQGQAPLFRLPRPEPLNVKGLTATPPQSPTEPEPQRELGSPSGWLPWEHDKSTRQ